MASNKPKGRARKARFTAVPHALMESDNYRHLNGWDVKLLLELVKQHNGSNNGDLSAAWGMMKNQGWRSSGTLFKSLAKLERLGFIERTRQGGKHQCNLFAITWYPIDECKGKHEVRATSTPSNRWKQPAPD
ncbi:MAG: MarR family transcriptional regulator [Ketobacter sp.]|nr:MarR family transcriptional regulator [Ketobacter sp.]